MEPERWRRIEEIYHAALEQKPCNRGEYLQQACGGDESLRLDLNDLLALEEQARDWIELPALELAAQSLSASLPTFRIGQTVDRYRILELKGLGGMGIVYSAHDSRLERTVALKFLLDEFTSEVEARETVGREATTLSRLNHPNICTIYDVGEAHGHIFIAMEYVPGTSLDRLIDSKGLPLNDVLKYAIEIADGLAKAHSVGVVHRDLKPSNIMITDEGHVKLLDFGLAKRAESAAGEAGKAQDTGRGVVAGTAAYMSPEQARGETLDTRSDVFAFGAVLYQMITGQQAFRGKSTISTISAVLNQEPQPIGALAKGAPAELEKLVRRCLQKNAENRFVNATEVLTSLQAIRDGLFSRELRETTRRRLIVAASLAVLIASAAVVALSSKMPAKSDGDLVITRLTSDAGLTTHPVISRDGKVLAYVSDRGGDNLDIWVQQLAGGSPVRLTNNPADDIQPDLSPDGSKLVFRSQRERGGIYLASTSGGEEKLLVAAQKALSPRFSPDGQSIAYSTGASLGTSGIHTLSSSGGEPREVKIQIPWAKSPIWSPDGRYLIFLGSTDPLGTGAYDWWVAPATGGQAFKTGAFAVLEQRGLSPFDETRGQDAIFSIAAVPHAWSKSDHIIFSARLGDSTNLWWVALDRKSWKIKGEPQRVTTGSGQEFSPSLADDGQLVFATVDQRQNLWMLPVNTNRGQVSGKAQALTHTGVSNFRPSLSRDGRRLVFLSDRSGNTEVWMREMDAGTERALTATPWKETHPHITADGSKIVYQSLEKSNPVLYVMPIDNGELQRLCDDCERPMGWSPDGTNVFVVSSGDLRTWRSVDVFTGRRGDIIRHRKYTVNMPRLSFSGNWLAFHVPMQDEERSPIFVAPFRSAPIPESEWIQVTDGRGIEATPWWSPDEGTLYFLSSRDGFQCIWAQRLGKSKRPSGDPLEIAHFHSAGHRVREVGFGPGVGVDKVIFTMNETSGNVWMTSVKSHD